MPQPRRRARQGASLLNGEEKDIFHRFETTFNQTRDKVASLEGAYVNLAQQVSEARQETREGRQEYKSLHSDLTAKIDTITNKIEEKSRVDWQPISLMITIIVGGISLLGLYMHLLVAPINYMADLNSQGIKEVKGDLGALQVASASSTTADASSRADRTQLNDRVQKLESEVSTELSDRRSQSAEMRVKLAEIETQFCASDAMRNLTHAFDMRIESVLWQHAFTDKFPTDNAYYPEICQRSLPDNGTRP